jgi:hypothetical protein
MIYKIMFLEGFADFSILEFRVKQGHIIDVSENVYRRIVSSGGKVKILETIVPPPDEKKEVKRGKA